MLILDSLDRYEILRLNNDITFKIPVGRISIGAKTCTLQIFPEDRTFEEIETIFKNPKNLTHIEHTDTLGNSVYNNLENYSILVNIAKLYHEAIYLTYNEDGAPVEYKSDIVEVSLRVPTMEDTMPKLQATMEYIAIMSDIDIDEEI